MIVAKDSDIKKLQQLLLDRHLENFEFIKELVSKDQDGDVKMADENNNHYGKFIITYITNNHSYFLSLLLHLKK